MFVKLSILFFTRFIQSDDSVRKDAPSQKLSAVFNFSSFPHTAHLQGPSSACHPPAGDPEPGSLQPHHSMDYQQPTAVSAPQ